MDPGRSPARLGSASSIAGAMAAALLLAVAGLCASCGSDTDGGDGDLTTTCGDGVCDGTMCETPLRCPRDCGVCEGAACNAFVGTGGSCGEPCTDSCDCSQPGEVCSADFDP